MCACNQNRVTIPLWTELSTFIHMIAPKGNSPIRKQRDHRPILILTKQSRGRTLLSLPQHPSSPDSTRWVLSALNHFIMSSLKREQTQRHMFLTQLWHFTATVVKVCGEMSRRGYKSESNMMSIMGYLPACQPCTHHHGVIWTLVAIKIWSSAKQERSQIQKNIGASSSNDSY